MSKPKSLHLELCIQPGYQDISYPIVENQTTDSVRDQWSDVWFTESILGIDEIGNMLYTMFKEQNLIGNI